MSKTVSPLRIVCKNCSSPLSFDIEYQTYRCPACGSVSPIEEKRRESLRLREIHKESLHAESAPFQTTACSSCGAKLIFPHGEVSNSCDFCGGSLIRSDAEEHGFAPDLIIPFVLTSDDAKARLSEWTGEHPKTAESRMINASLNDLRGYYLPYEIVSGSVEIKTNRAGVSRNYMCRSYIENTPVNCVREMDYTVLDASEPFDLNGAVPFEYAYIAGHRALISNMSDNDIDRRVRRRTADAYLPAVQKTLHDSDIRIKIVSDSMLSASALFPMYVLKKGRLSAVVNGQTGRVAVSLKDKEKKPFPFWAAEALIYTAAVTLILCAVVSFTWEYAALFGIFFGLLFFVVMGYDRAPISARVIKRGEKVQARREDGRLLISRNELSVPKLSPLVFYENIEGRKTAVEYKFLPPRRILSLAVQSLAMIFTPVVVAGAIAAVRGVVNGNGALTEISEIDLRGGSIWFIFTVVFGVIFTMWSARIKAYDKPYIYEIVQNGERRLTGNAKMRRMTLFDCVFAEKEVSDSVIKSKRGVLFIICAIAVFILSVLDMLTV